MFARYAALLLMALPIAASASLPLPTTEAPVLVAGSEDAAAKTPAEASESPFPTLYIEKPISLRPGQALATLLQEQGFTTTEANSAAGALRPHYNPRQMKAGQELLLNYVDNGQSTIFDGLIIHTPNDKTVTVQNQGDNRWKAKAEKRTLVTKRYTAVGTIADSLFESGNRAGLTDRLTMELIDIFSWEYDFTRELRPGDSFKVVFEKIYTPEGQLVRTGNILAASLDTRGRDSEAFRGPQGIYFGPDGLSKERMLLRTPLKFSRISSNFNLNRRHPVLGYTRAHKGTDFAAPSGTPVKASGNGKVEFVGWHGGHGKFIKIRHNGTYQTAYAHLSGYAKGMRPGVYVTQGQVIGYVGSTGMSSGPHLHYEVVVNNRHVNAMTAKLPVGMPIDRKQKGSLMALVHEARAAWATAPQQVAELKMD